MGIRCDELCSPKMDMVYGESFQNFDYLHDVEPDLYGEKFFDSGLSPSGQ